MGGDVVVDFDNRFQHFVVYVLYYIRCREHSYITQRERGF